MTTTGEVLDPQRASATTVPAVGSTAETDDHRAFADSITAALAASWDDDDIRAIGLGDGVDEEVHWRLLLDSGLPAVPVAEDRGGFGGTWLDIVSATERVGGALLPNPLISSFAAVAMLIRADNLGTDLLTRAAAGEIRLTVAADHTATQWSDPRALPQLECAASPVRPGDRVTVSGHTGPFLRPSADTLLVPAATPEGPVVLAVAAADCVITDSTGLDLLRPLGRITFDRSPGTVVLDASAAAHALADGHAAAILALTCEEVGICQRVLDRAVTHARERMQFGKPIGSFQGVAHRLADVFVEMELARSAARHLAAVLDAGHPTGDYAALAHHQGVRALRAGSSSAIQVMGALGYTWESTAHHAYRKAGTDAVLLGPSAARLPAATVGGATGRNRVGGLSAECQEFVERELKAHRQDWGDDDSYVARRSWQQRLHRGGWIGLGWPRAFGGRGLSVREQVTCERVLAAAGAPELAGILGVNNVGPTLMALGTPEQQSHLPRILSTEELWCQGFSEPETGSDLAGLRCRADRVGDEYVINGQKIWTTDGMDATHIELMVRTDPATSRHDGISVLLVPLDTRGITRRPIVQLNGRSGFAEIFFDDVRVPVSALLGEEGKGWSVSRTTLAFERTGVLVLAARLEQAATDVVAEIDQASLSVAVQSALAEAHARARLLDFHGTRLLSAIESGSPPGPEQAIIKLAWSQVTQLLGEVRLAATAEQALEPDRATESAYLRSRSATIAGGTTEIMKNVIAQRVLGLPR